jgi:nitrate reductase assembly molybdenum cofactor insertion protein NarJ
MFNATFSNISVILSVVLEFISIVDSELVRDCLTPTQQFFSYIMARTKNIKIKAETVMFLHSLSGKCINLWKKVQKKHCIKIPIVLKDLTKLR